MSALWSAGWAGKLAAFATGLRVVTFGSASLPDLNFILNMGTIVLVILVALPVAKDRRKTQTIKEQNDLLEIVTKERDQYAHANRNLEQGAQHLKTELAHVSGAYEELQKYTAQPAVEHFEALLSAHSATVAERHKLMLDTLERMTRTLGAVERRLTNGA